MTSEAYGRAPDRALYRQAILGPELRERLPPLQFSGTPFMEGFIPGILPCSVPADTSRHPPGDYDHVIISARMLLRGSIDGIRLLRRLSAYRRRKRRVHTQGRID